MTDTQQSILGAAKHPDEKLRLIVETMREMSTHTDPQAMVKDYIVRMQDLMPVSRRISLSRRQLQYPYYRITRYSGWDLNVNPWKEQHQLPVLKGGLLAELIYGNEPVIIHELHVAEDDPAAEYLQGQCSLLALPQYDRGESLNMVIVTQDQPCGFDPAELPEIVWMSNLFGRATHSLVMADQLKQAYAELDGEFEAIGDIQRSLLPTEFPDIPTIDLAAHYETSRRAGGDYYDVFVLPEDKLGILVADVSGHGPPAAVVMAITHGLAHSFHGPYTPPSELLGYLNRHLAKRYTSIFGGFVTAFYGVYDPATRTMIYASAGHNPPRLKRCADGSVLSLDDVGGFPLGIMPEAHYDEAEHHFVPGDQIVFYTDGISEAMNPQGKMFGMGRLDKALENCSLTAGGLIQSVLHQVEEFAEGQPADDDRTLLVAKIS